MTATRDPRASSVRRSLRGSATAAAGVAILVGCSGGGPTAHVGAPVPKRSGAYLLPVPTPSPAGGVTNVAGVNSGPEVVFAKTPDGVVLPNRGLTPGSAFTDVREAEICELHFTLGVRQPRFNAKVFAFSQYGVSIHDREDYQVDHLIPVSLGGDNTTKNLWPQPYAGTRGAHQKDVLERQLRGLVCSKQLSLRQAQQAIAKDWWQAYRQYMGRKVPAAALGLELWKPPTPEPGRFAVINGGPCPKAGQIGFTTGKRVRYTCTKTGDGTLRWQKRA